MVDMSVITFVQFVEIRDAADDDNCTSKRKKVPYVITDKTKLP